MLRAHPRLFRLLLTLIDVGLGYIRLGQSAATLSGGEAQRVKLARELAPARDRAAPSTSWTSPPPACTSTTSRKLLHVLGRLVDAGNTVVVIEHNLDVVKSADHVIDLGPEAGAARRPGRGPGHAGEGGALAQEPHRPLPACRSCAGASVAAAARDGDERDAIRCSRWRARVPHPRDDAPTS